MTSNKTLSAAVAAFATCLCLSSHAADATITKDQAKDLKTQSEAQYNARKKVAEERPLFVHCPECREAAFALRCFGQRSPDAEPTGKHQPVLSPSKHPGDCADSFDAMRATRTIRRPRSKSR